MMKFSNLNESGFTLIEMMIAAALGLIVSLAAMGVLNYSSLSYNVQEDIAAMQQDIRVAKIFIERDAILAGSELEDVVLVNDMVEGDKEPVAWENGKGENGSDILTIRYVVPMESACSEAPADAAAGAFPCDALPVLTTATKFTETGSVNAEVAEDINGTLWTELKATGCYCKGKNYVGNSLELEVLVTAPDNKDDNAIGFLSKITDHSNIGDVVNNRDTKDEDGVKIDGRVLADMPVGSSFKFFANKPVDAAKYYIENGVLVREYDADISGGTGMVKELIAEHIEDLQFAFGLDTNDDDVIDRWVDGKDSSDVTGDGDLVAALKPQIRAIRINVLGRTAKARKEIEPSVRPALEDHAASDEPDYFRRRLSSVSVELRNM